MRIAVSASVVALAAVALTPVAAQAAKDPTPAPVISGDPDGEAPAEVIALRGAAAKLGHWIAPGKWHAGELRIAAIGIPPGAPAHWTVTNPFGVIQPGALDTTVDQDKTARLSFVTGSESLEQSAEGTELNEPDPDTFYTRGPDGYTDYPTLDQVGEVSRR